MKTATVKRPPAPLTAEPIPTPPAPLVVSKIKKVNFGGIAATAPKKAATEYPALPDADGTAAALVARILTRTEELAALDAALEMDKAELRAFATPFYFERHHGQLAIPSSVEAFAADGKKVLIGFQNRYAPLADDGPVVALIGDRAERYFRQAFELKVVGDNIPEAALEPNEDGVPLIVAELQELFQRHNAGAALTAKAIIKPTTDFHIARHTALTVEENLELQKIVPFTIAVGTKGREKKAA